MPWEVHIAGPEETLQELAQAFPYNPSVTRQGDAWVLRSQTFDILSDAGAVREQAERMIDSLSALSRLLLQSKNPLEIMSLTQITDGTHNLYVQLRGEEIRANAGFVRAQRFDADGTVKESRPSDPAPAWLAKAEGNPQVARALRLRNSQNLMWTDLHRLYEVIRAGVGGDAAIVAAGWTSGNQLERFTRSANSVTVAGDVARHGVERSHPPANPMTLSQARAFVDALLRNWLDA